MKPFSKESCIFHLRLTLFRKQVEIATDSPRIHELLANSLGSRFFAPTASPPERTFYCSVQSEGWDMIMGFPMVTWLCKKTDQPSTYDVYRWTPEGLEPEGRFCYYKSPDFTSVPTDYEVFAAHFQRVMLEMMLKEEPDTFRLVHGGALAHKGKGLLMLGATKGGKSTLTLACVMAGMQFLSDDHIPVDLLTAKIHPFPRMLRLRQGTCDMFPDFASLCSNREVDAVGEPRFFLHPENLRQDALGEPVRLSHIVYMRGFAERPSLIPAKPFEMAYSCSVADFYAPEEGAMNLVWHWSGIMDAGVRCADLYVGHPMETARALMAFMENDVTEAESSYSFPERSSVAVAGIR